MNLPRLRPGPFHNFTALIIFLYPPPCRWLRLTWPLQRWLMNMQTEIWCMSQTTSYKSEEKKMLFTFTHIWVAVLTPYLTNGHWQQQGLFIYQRGIWKQMWHACASRFLSLTGEQLSYQIGNLYKSKANVQVLSASLKQALFLWCILPKRLSTTTCEIKHTHSAFNRR